MKIAILSDLHSNLPALRAVVEDLGIWKPDQVIVAGDIINRGPKPAECLEIILENKHRLGWHVLRGNHEEYVLMHTRPDAPRSGPAFEVHRPSYWTYEKTRHLITAVQELPDQTILEDPNGGEVRIVHASLIHNRDGIYPETSDHDLVPKLGLQKRGPEAPPLTLFGVGHTHRSLVRALNGTLVVNAGSVGLPFDFDQRLAYARLTWEQGNWHADIVRLAYDIEQATQDFFKTGYLYEGGPLTELVLLELQHAVSLLYGWANQYQQLASAGRLSIRETVDLYLKQIMPTL